MEKIIEKTWRMHSASYNKLKFQKKKNTIKLNDNNNINDNNNNNNKD